MNRLYQVLNTFPVFAMIACLVSFLAEQWFGKATPAVPVFAIFVMVTAGFASTILFNPRA